jgi:hypothetical protein
MKKIIIASLLTFGLSPAAMSAQLKGDYPACISKDAFERLSAIIQHDDQEALKEISKTECFMPKKGLPIEKVESMGWTSGVAHVKIYASGQLFDLWTNSENLKSD